MPNLEKTVKKTKEYPKSIVSIDACFDELIVRIQVRCILTGFSQALTCEWLWNCVTENISLLHLEAA